MENNYLQHAWGKKTSHKYIKKYQNPSGKWIYVYADDLKSNANFLKNKVVSGAVRGFDNAKKTVNTIRKETPNFISGLKVGSTGKTTSQAQQEYSSQAAKNYAQAQKLGMESRQGSRNVGYQYHRDIGYRYINKMHQSQTKGFSLGNKIGNIGNDTIKAGKLFVSNAIKAGKNTISTAKKTTSSISKGFEYGRGSSGNVRITKKNSAFNMGRIAGRIFK